MRWCWEAAIWVAKAAAMVVAAAVQVARCAPGSAPATALSAAQATVAASCQMRSLRAFFFARRPWTYASPPVPGRALLHSVRTCPPSAAAYRP